MAFSPFNHLLLCTASLDKRLLFHDVNDCKTVKEIVAEEPVSALSFMDDGVTVAVGTLKGSVLLYDLRAGNSPKYSSQSHKGAVNSLAFQQVAAATTTGKSKLTKGALSESAGGGSMVGTSATHTGSARSEPASTTPSAASASTVVEPGPTSTTSTPSGSFSARPAPALLLLSNRITSSSPSAVSMS